MNSGKISSRQSRAKLRRLIIFNKTCINCSADFVASGPAGKYCEDCQDFKLSEQRRKNRERNERARRAKGCKVGRGALPGKDHPNYKHGYYVAQTQSGPYRQKVRYCERCGVDTFELSRWHWVMHHKDHDHSNHNENNLELLCKKCHAKDHKIENNFKGSVTTISKESTSK